MAGADDEGAEEQAEQVPAPTVTRAQPKVNPPAELVLNGNREDNFRTFKSRWLRYSVLTRLDSESEAYQSALLLYTAGDEATKVVESSAKYVTDQSCKAILDILEQHCIGERNDIHERHKFYSRSQLPSESFDALYAEDRTLANRCNFDYKAANGDRESPADEMLRDRIIMGVRYDGM